MLPPLAYLDWAIAQYPQARFDLATSGMPTLRADAIGTSDELLAEVTHTRPSAGLTGAIARRFGVDVGQVVPTLGTTHGNFCVYAALLSPGDDVLVESPCYEPLVRVAEGLGARVVYFTRDLAAGAPLDPVSVARAMTPKTKLVVVSNLHNPTGAYADDATIRAVAELARDAGARLLVDEVYRDLVDYEDARGRTAFHLADNVIVTSSLTKVYGLGWARAGWVLAQEDVARQVFQGVLHTVGDTSAALSHIGALAIERIGKLHAMSRERRANDTARIAQVVEFVKRRPRLSFTAVTGSIFGFVRDDRGVDLRPIIERAVVDEQVIVAPGSFFREPSGFRLRYGALSEEVLTEGLVRLGRALDR